MVEKGGEERRVEEKFLFWFCRSRRLKLALVP